MFKKHQKKIAWAPKVEKVFSFLFAPFGCVFLNYITVLLLISFVIDHEIGYWSYERLYYQLIAVGISFFITFV